MRWRNRCFSRRNFSAAASVALLAIYLYQRIRRSLPGTERKMAVERRTASVVSTTATVAERIKNPLVYQVLRRCYKRTSRVLEAYIRTIRVPSFPLTDTFSLFRERAIVVRRTSFTAPSKSWINEHLSRHNSTWQRRTHFDRCWRS